MQPSYMQEISQSVVKFANADLTSIVKLNPERFTSFILYTKCNLTNEKVYAKQFLCQNDKTKKIINQLGRAQKQVELKMQGDETYNYHKTNISPSLKILIAC